MISCKMMMKICVETLEKVFLSEKNGFVEDLTAL